MMPPSCTQSKMSDRHEYIVPNRVMAEAFSILAHVTRLPADKYRNRPRHRSYVTVAKYTASHGTRTAARTRARRASQPSQRLEECSKAKRRNNEASARASMYYVDTYSASTALIHPNASPLARFTPLNRNSDADSTPESRNGTHRRKTKAAKLFIPVPQMCTFASLNRRHCLKSELGR